MLRHGENVFLDDRTTDDLSGAIGLKVRVVQDGGEEFLRAVLGLPPLSDMERQTYEL